MNDQLSVFGSAQSAIDSCERMYSAKFRTESFLLGEDVSNYTVSGLMTDLARYVYNKAGFPFPLGVEPTYNDSDDYNFDYDENDYHYNVEEENYNERAEQHLKSNFPDLIIDKNTLVVELCNYKGEGEGLALACLCENLPVFKSKNESFYQVNR